MVAAEVLKIPYAVFRAEEDGRGPKREYWDGFVLAMAGGSIRHAALSSRLLTALAVSLRGRTCQSYNSDLRIRVESVNASFYPDVSVICGPVQVASDDDNAIVNPTLVVEVLSPSTQSYDRVAKWNAYSRLTALKAYLLVDSVSGIVELYERNDDPDRWTKIARLGESGGVLRIEALAVDIDLSEVFAGLSELPS